MKFLCTLLILSFYLHSKAQEPKFNGIGELRVRVTTLTFIDSLLVKSKKKIKKVQRYAAADDQNNMKYIVEYTKPDDKCYSSNNPIIPQHKIYVVYNYVLLDQYVCSKVFLDFYQDTLYHFIITDPVFVSDFKTKYGEPIVDEIRHQNTCTIGGETMKYEDKDRIENWDDQYMHAAFVTNVSRGPDCEIKNQSSFEIKDMETSKVVQLLEFNEFKRCQALDATVKMISEKF